MQVDHHYGYLSLYYHYQVPTIVTLFKCPPRSAIIFTNFKLPSALALIIGFHPVCKYVYIMPNYYHDMYSCSIDLAITDYTFSARCILAPLWIRNMATAVRFSKREIPRDVKPFYSNIIIIIWNGLGILCVVQCFDDQHLHHVPGAT